MKPYKIIILIICFALTSIFIYQTPTSTPVEKQVLLSQALIDINGWTMSRYTPLGPEIVKALELDDYVNQHYSNGNDTISLYIGYYLTNKKIGAAHDPLVCFPGQGWVISDRKKGNIILNSKPKNSVSYSSMIAEKAQQKELIIYWFQSYDQASPDTFTQKVAALWKKIGNKGEDNAFVRISIPFGKKSLSQSHEVIYNFIRSFYPVFLEYVKEERLS